MQTYEVPIILADADGNPRAINPAKLGENWMALQADNYPLTMQTSGPATTGFSPPEDGGVAGDFEACAIVGRSTVPCVIEMSLVGVDANALMNVPAHHSIVLGRRGLPSALAETLLIQAGGRVLVIATQLTTAVAGTLSLALLGRKFNTAMPPDEAAARMAFLTARPTRPFWLSLDNTSKALAASGESEDLYMSMPSGAFFAAEDILYKSTGRFQVKLYDGNSGRELTNGWTDIDLIAGTGGLPARTLGSPLVQPRKSIRVLLKDTSGAANTIYLTFHGQRLNLAPPVAA